MPVTLLLCVNTLKTTSCETWNDQKWKTLRYSFFSFYIVTKTVSQSPKFVLSKWYKAVLE